MTTAVRVRLVNEARRRQRETPQIHQTHGFFKTNCGVGRVSSKRTSSRSAQSYLMYGPGRPPRALKHSPVSSTITAPWTCVTRTIIFGEVGRNTQSERQGNSERFLRKMLVLERKIPPLLTWLGGETSDANLDCLSRAGLSATPQTRTAALGERTLRSNVFDAFCLFPTETGQSSVYFQPNQDKVLLICKMMYLLGSEAALLPRHIVRLPLQLREVHLLVLQGEWEAAAENLLHLPRPQM